MNLNASDIETAPAGGEQLVHMKDLARFEPVDSPHGSSQLVEVDGPGFTQAIRITSDHRGKPWDAEASLPLERGIKKGEVLLMRLHLRKIDSKDESRQAFASISVSMRRPPWSSPVSRNIAVGSEWEAFWIPGIGDRDLDPGDLFLKLSCGEIPQTLEIGGIELWTYGTEARLEDMPATVPEYAGMEAGAAWRKAAESRIRDLRMAPLALKVIDRAGKPVEDATVSVEMVRHAFQFGSAVRAIDFAGPDAASNSANRERFQRHFNSATFENDTKWPAWIGEWEATFSRDQTLAALEWFHQHNYHFRGHVLVWPSWHNLPGFIQPGNTGGLSPQAIEDLILSHIDDLTLATRGYIREWDVLNEPRDNHDIMDLAGQGVMADWFKRARERLPEADLALNDFGILSSKTDTSTVEPYLQSVDFLLQNKAPLTILGIQGHMGGSFSPPERLLDILDRLHGETGLPVRITEYDLRTEFPDLVETYTRDFLTVMFSHPSVRGVQTWGMHVIVEEDGTLTAAGRAWMDLTRGEWWTRETGRTGEKGTWQTHAYLGKHRISVEKGGQVVSSTVHLEKEMMPVVITLP